MSECIVGGLSGAKIVTGNVKLPDYSTSGNTPVAVNLGGRPKSIIFDSGGCGRHIDLIPTAGMMIYSDVNASVGVQVAITDTGFTLTRYQGSGENTWDYVAFI